MSEHITIQKCEINRADMKREYYKGFEKINHTLTAIKVEMSSNNAKTDTVIDALNKHITQQWWDFKTLYAIMWTVLVTAVWAVWTVLYHLMTR